MKEIYKKILKDEYNIVKISKKMNNKEETSTNDWWLLLHKEENQKEGRGRREKGNFLGNSSVFNSVNNINNLIKNPKSKGFPLK